MPVIDNSMSPQINEGSTVLFRAVDKYESGDIVIINNEWGESMIRRYRRKENIILFTADNPEYPTLRPDEGYHVVAKVIEVLTRRKV